MAKYNELVAKFNQVQDASTKVRERKDPYKNESVSLSGSMTNNVDDLKEANKVIKDLEAECNEIASSVSLDKDIIPAAAKATPQLKT